MPIFISHSFKDDARFDDLCYVLKSEGVPFWKPEEMRAGASLREQMCDAIEKCEMCIFLATHNSVNSAWCSAELGAFWASRKKVVIYVADDSLSDEDLPKQFTGDVWYRKIRELVSEAKATLNEEKDKKTEVAQKQESSPKVGDVSIGAFVDLLRSSMLLVDNTTTF